MIQDQDFRVSSSSSLKYERAVQGSFGSFALINRVVTRGFALFLGALLVQIGTDCLLSQSSSSYARSQFASAQPTTAQTRPVQDPRPKRDVPAVTQRYVEEMSKVTEILSPDEGEDEDEKEFDPEAEDTRDLPRAQELLDRLLSRRWLNDNERAQTHQTYAWLAQDSERTELAIEHLLKLLDYRESVRYTIEERALDGLSRLYYSIENYESSLDYALQFMDLALTVNANQCSYVAQIYLNLEDWENVKKWVKLAIDKKKEMSRPVPESWWQLLLYALTTLEHWDEALETLKILVVEFPKRDYWLGMAQAYAELEQENNSMYTLEAAHSAGMFARESDYTNLANRVYLADAPQRAVWIFEDGFEKEIVERSAKNLKRYAQYQWIARDYDAAIEAYLQSLELEPNGITWQRVAQLYMQVNQYKECADACDMAVDSGDLEDEYSVRYQKGLCQFFGNDFEGASETLVDLRNDVRGMEDRETLLRNVRIYIEAVDTEFRRIQHEQEVSDLERAYREEKAKAQS